MTNNKAELKLHHLIRSISDEYFFASWLLDIEFYLWSYIHNDGKVKCNSDFSKMLRDRYGAELKKLSEEAGGWWYWDSRTFKAWDHVAYMVEDQPIGERFAKTNDWLVMYNNWTDTR